MRDIYITSNWMGREELLYNRLLEGFNLPPIAARAVVELSMDVLLDDNKTPGSLGQIKYIAISDMGQALETLSVSVLRGLTGKALLPQFFWPWR